MIKGESIGLSMMMKTGMQVFQYYTVFNYVPPRPQKYLKTKDRTIVSGPGMKLAPKMVPPGNRKDKFGKETPQMR